MKAVTEPFLALPTKMPVMDVQSTAKSQPLPRQVLDAIPAGRTLQPFAGIVPASI